MASNIKTPELSPRQALTNIRQRMEAAIEEGKKKAGVSVKTEAVFEGAGETTNKYDDDIDFGEWDQPSEPSANTNNKYDDDIDFGESSQPSEVQATANNKYDDNIDFDKPVATGGKGNVPAKEAVPEQPSVFASKKPRRLSREEREANEKRLREFEQQRNAEWNYSKAEISTEMKSLFSLADENREYLKNAGRLITADEFQSIFFAEYRNYLNKNLQSTTLQAIEGIPRILAKKGDWIITQIDERLHGNGDFLRNGSLMDYLLAASHKENVTRTASLKRTSKLVIKDNDKDNGLSQFILASDLEECEEWLRKRFGKFDVSSSTISDYAVDILTNGTNRSGIKEKLGGQVELTKKYATAKYASIEREGDNVVVIGPQDVLIKFNHLIDPYMSREDRSPDYDGAEITPVSKIGLHKFHGGMYASRYDEKKYMDVLNTLVNEGQIIPIAFNAGTVSVEQLNASASKGGGNSEGRAGEMLMQHRIEDGVDTINSDIGEKYATDKLMQVLGTPGAKKLAQMSGTEKELAAATQGTTSELGDVARFSAAVLKWLGGVINVPCTVNVVNSIPVATLDTDKSIVALAGKNIDLDTGIRAVITAINNFNHALSLRFKDIKNGGDISDIPNMSTLDIRSKVVPDVNLGELAEKCFDALHNKYGTGAKKNAGDDPLIAFGKGYLVYMMAPMFKLKTDSISIISDVREFAKAMSAPVRNVGLIHDFIVNMGPSEVVGMALRLSEYAAVTDIGQEDTPEFYPDTVVSLLHLDKSGILGAIGYITESDPVRCVYETIETLTGMKPGSLSMFMNELDTCSDKEAIMQGAREIKKTGSDLINIHMSDSGKSVVKAVPNKPSTKAVPPKPVAHPRFIGRNRF